MQVNTQKAEKPVNNPHKIIMHHAWETMQGEGPHAGRPAVFVRLSGCNIQCPACDTEYTSQRHPVSPVELLEVVKAIRPSGLVVLTGGEPLRQDIALSVMLLLDNGYEVQIETNGTLYRDLPFWHPNFMVVCSPKMPGVNMRLASRVKAWKYIIDAEHVDASDGLPTTTMHGLGAVARPPMHNMAPIYVQPLDVDDPIINARNLEAAVKSCMTYGYRLCLQMHKIIGLE